MILRAIELSAAGIGAKTAPIEVGNPKQASAPDFAGVMKQTRTTSSHEELMQVKEKILSGKNISSQDLLLYQIKAQGFSMQIELVSKVAESLSGTLKRFQNQ